MIFLLYIQNTVPKQNPQGKRQRFRNMRFPPRSLFRLFCQMDLKENVRMYTIKTLNQISQAGLLRGAGNGLAPGIPSGKAEASG